MESNNIMYKMNKYNYKLLHSKNNSNYKRKLDYYTKIQYGGTINDELMNILGAKFVVDAHNLKLIVEFIYKYNTSLTELCENEEIIISKILQGEIINFLSEYNHTIIHIFAIILNKFFTNDNDFPIFYHSGKYDKCITTICCLIKKILDEYPHIKHVHDNSLRIPFDYIKGISLIENDNLSIYLEYLECFAMLAPIKYVINENTTNIIDILNYSANSCYDGKTRSIIYNIVEKFDKQSKLLKKKLIKFLTLSIQRNDVPLIILLRRFFQVTPNEVEQIIWDKCFRDSTLKFFVKYHGTTFNNFFVVPQNISIIFLASSGEAGLYSMPLKDTNDQTTYSCNNNKQRVSTYNANVDTVLSNYRDMGLLHIYETHSIVPNIFFDLKDGDNGFWGTMFFDDADIAYDDIENNDIYLSNTGTSKTQKLKYNEPYFGKPTFLSEIVQKTVIMNDYLMGKNDKTKHMEDKQSLFFTFVVTSCRIDDDNLVYKDIYECMQKYDKYMFNNTSFDNIIKRQIDPNTNTNTLRRSVSFSHLRRINDDNSFDNKNIKLDLLGMLQHIKFPKLCKKVKKMLASIVEGKPFYFYELCEIYRLVYIFSMKYQNNNDIDFEDLKNYVKARVSSLEYIENVGLTNEPSDCAL